MKRYQANFEDGSHIQYKITDDTLSVRFDKEPISIIEIKTKLNVSQPTHYLECWKHKKIEWTGCPSSIGFLQQSLDDTKRLCFKTVAILYIQEK